MVSTFSRHPICQPANWPQEIVSARGAEVRDATGRSWIDWTWSGAGILGHAHPVVNLAVAEQMAQGYAIGHAHRAEREASEALLAYLHPLQCAQAVRWCLNGTDAVAGAVRLARAVTGRDRVLVFEGAYHGASAEWFLAAQRPGRGVPACWPGVRFVPWNDPARLESALVARTAAVVFEVGADPTPDMVQALNRIRDFGALLIADEVVTGFRLGPRGACGEWGIEPDLACYGKALGSGVPVAALVGRAELMREFDLAETTAPVFMSYTHAGNAIGMAAAKATLGLLTSEVYDAVDMIGVEFAGAWAYAMDSRELKGRMAGQFARHSLRFEGQGGCDGRDLLDLFRQEMCDRGVLIGPTNCPMLPHAGEPVEEACDQIPAALDVVRRAVEAGSVDGLLMEPRPRRLFAREAVKR